MQVWGFEAPYSHIKGLEITPRIRGAMLCCNSCDEHLADILDIMIKAGYQVSVHVTQAGGDATKQTVEQ